jgi:hypothetical protein
VLLAAVLSVLAVRSVFAQALNTSAAASPETRRPQRGALPARLHFLNMFCPPA